MKSNVISSVVIIVLLFFVSTSCKKETKAKLIKEEKVESTKLKSLEVNDYTIHYLDKGSGSPVVFVHGGVGDYRTWEAQIEAFSKTHRVIAISRRYAFPNVQETNENNDYSVTQHAKDLSQFLKTLNLGPVHLVGHSYGAFTSLMTTLEQPELVKSLTLGEPPVMSFLQYNPNAESLINHFISNIQIPTAQAFNSSNNEKAVEIFIGGVLNDSLYYSKTSKKNKDLMMDNAFGLKGVILTENPFPPLGCEDVKNLKTPTLLIKGEKSPEMLTSIIDELGKCINNSLLVTLPDASHGLEYENPIAFNTIVLDFIDKY